MKILLAISGFIDLLSAALGQIANWAVLASCLISAGSRYLFSESSNAWLEIQWYLFSAIFLLGAARTLRVNGHVRVDLAYSHIIWFRRMNQRRLGAANRKIPQLFGA